MRAINRVSTRKDLRDWLDVKSQICLSVYSHWLYNLCLLFFVLHLSKRKKWTVSSDSELSLHVVAVSFVSPWSYPRDCSVQFKVVSIYALGKAYMRSTPSLRSFPNVALETVPMLVWLTMWPFLVLSRKITERFLFLRLSPPGDQWCDVLGCVPAGTVSSTSPPQIFRMP